MKIEVINPIHYPDWDNLVLSTEQYTVFHSAAWARVLSETYHFTPYYFSVIDNGKLLALIPVMEVYDALFWKKGVGLPFSDYCEPIVSNDVTFSDVLDHAIEFGRKKCWRYFSLRGLSHQNIENASSTDDFKHTLLLSEDPEKIHDNFRESTKRNIAKAIASGVKVESCMSFEFLNHFYKLNCVTRKQHGLPPQPFSFFKNIYKNLLSERSQGLIVNALYRGRYIASNMYLHFGNSAVYKYGASSYEYQHLRANNLVMWEAIRYYCNNGYAFFCFGKTEPHHKGLLQFKHGFRGAESLIKNFTYDYNSNKFISENPKVSGFQNALFRKTPIPFLKMIGKVGYRFGA